MNKLLVEKYGTRLHVHTLLLQSGGGGGRDAKATKLTLRIVVFLGRAHIACFMRAALYELPPLRRRLAATIMASTFIKI